MLDISSGGGEAKLCMHQTFPSHNDGRTAVQSSTYGLTVIVHDMVN